MAQAAANQKRKRGRTSGASQARDALDVDALAPGGTQLEDDDAEEHPRPSKRGRPGRKKGDALQLLDNNAAEGRTRRTRGSGGFGEQEDPSGEGATGGPRRSRRERRSAEENPWWATGVAGVTTQEHSPEQHRKITPPGRKRGRKSVGEAAPSSGGANARLHGSSTQTEPGALSSSKKRGARRASDQQARRSTAQAPDTYVHSEEPQRRKGRPRTSNGVTEPSQRSTAHSSRRRSGEADEEASQGTSTKPRRERAQYRHLVARERNIPRSTIATWSPLDKPSLEVIASMIAASYRPVLLRLSGRERRQEQAHNALRTFGRRLQSKLHKGIPFPPPSVKSAGARGNAAGGASSHADELDFERTIDATLALEANLNPLLHSIALLKAERDKEEAALEEDYAALRILEANARSEAREWRDRTRRSHALASDQGKHSNDEEVKISFAGGFDIVTPGEQPVGSAFTDLQEPELASLSQQLGSHMETLNGNLAQMNGVLPAVVTTKAALQGFLHGHLGHDQYEDVLLG